MRRSTTATRPYRLYFRGAMTLPEHVVPSIARTLKSDFRATAAPMDGGTLVSWVFDEALQRTLPPGTRSELHPSQEVRPLAVGSEKVNSGSFRIDFTTGTTSPVGSAETNQLRSRTAEIPFETQQSNNDQHTPLLSVDGQSSMVSERTGGPADLQKYTLIVMDRKTSKQLGRFRSHTSVVPFIVIGSRVLYESTLYRYRDRDRLVEQPRRIEAVDLSTGSEVWSLELRDTVYRGAFPP